MYKGTLSFREKIDCRCVDFIHFIFSSIIVVKKSHLYNFLY